MSSQVDLDQLTKQAAKNETDSYTWTYANGRRYAASELGHYYMPNDEPEIHRLNQQHWMLTEARGGTITLAPLRGDPDVKILDIGCGSGIWCLQMAEDFPTAKIIGSDISPIQPANKPANVEWAVLDFETGDWPYPEEHFNLIHLSLVHGCVADWPATLKKIVKYIKPGGYLEHQEFAMGAQYFLGQSGERLYMSEISDPTAYAQWPGLMTKAADLRGRTLHLGPKLKGWQRDVGLEHVTEMVYPLSVGTWPEDERQRRIGTQFLLNMLNGIDGFTTAMFTKVLGWDADATKAYIEECKVDLRNNDLKKMIDLYVVYGQKAV